MTGGAPVPPALITTFKVPVEIELVDALPRTGSGKVQKGRLRAVAPGSA
jgi:acyl-coenzyme A synthetase/AMP-(fatty) acid ligase